MFDDLTEEGLLDALDAERSKFTSMDRERYIHMIDALVSRGVYPTDTVEGNPNTVHAMVSGWGARWHVWKAPLACRHCGTDLRDSVTGPPFKREIAQYDRLADCTVGIVCPDCKKNI